ncbi:MAG: hypothetical protein LBC85_07710 [Fibromonadaceae bacterium]|jgi:hypothetical protein|nr:hypothetical protein [Fibromonadaceae bacterium]
MLRQVLTPSKENSTVSIPAEFYGMEVEVFVYPFYKSSKSIDDIFNEHLYSFGNFKFNRNEANDYE